MLFLLFQLGKDRYALDTNQIVEILPLVGIKQIPHAPDCVAGLINYRGTPVPVLDLNQLALGQPAHRRLSTRIIVVRLSCKDGQNRPLGLLAERATETLLREPGDFMHAGLHNADAAYLGPVTTDARGLIQRIDVSKLLPASVSEMLFTPLADNECLSTDSKSC